MKKFILFSFIFVFFTINIGSTSAQVYSGVSGCTATSAYSVTTGQTCSTITTTSSSSRKDPEPLRIITISIPTVLIGELYNVDLMASGGNGLYTWSLDSGRLPNGIAISNDKGVLPCFVEPCPASQSKISGISTEEGTFNFSLRVTSGNVTASQDYRDVISFYRISIPNRLWLPAVLNWPYFQTLDTEPPIQGFVSKWKILEGKLPSGLAIHPHPICEYPPCPAAITGTPTALGRFPFKVELRAYGQTVTADLLLRVNPTVSSNLTPTTSADCAPGDLFSSVTGQLCSATVNNPLYSDSAVFARDLSASLKSRGNDVKTLQRYLKDEGYLFGKADGKFGKVTGRAVGDFQEDNDLSRTEIVDAPTRVILNRIRSSNTSE